MNEINVTPLIDVMLVLLVIFMVTAPLLTTGVQVDLPKVKSSPMQTDDSKLLLVITADEHVYLGKDEITQDVENKLKTNARLQEEKEVSGRREREIRRRPPRHVRGTQRRRRKARDDYGPARGQMMNLARATYVQGDA
jgi:biopolymer transport protein TolR